MTERQTNPVPATSRRRGARATESRFPGISPLARRLTAAAVLLCLFPVLCTATAEQPVLETGDVAVSWNADAGGVAGWRIRDPTDAPGLYRISLVSDATGGAHLQWTGAGIDPAAWRPVSGRGNDLVMETGALDGQLRIVQRLAPGDGPYRLVLEVSLENRSDTPVPAAALDDLRLVLGPGLGESPAAGMGIAETLYSYVEAIVRGGGDTARHRLSGPDDAGPLPAGEDGVDWAGLHSRYFALLLAPGEDTAIGSLALRMPESVPAHMPERLLPVLEIRPEWNDLGPGAERKWTFRVYSGPKSGDALAAGDGEFADILFAGQWQWMRGLCFGLLWLLGWLQALIGSWGLAIIALAVLVRAALYPLARRALASQQEFVEVQRKIQPEMQEIKCRYRGGEQSERLLGLYERHGVSPLAGLKPLGIVALQIPVFIALFHVLGQAFELRQAPFLWIDTLAEPDRLFALGVDLPFFGAHFHLLPVLMAATTLMTMKLAPAPAADAGSRRRQNLFLGLMAAGFFVLFWPFPAGMVLYWTVANLLHIAQARLMSRAGG